VSHKLDRGDVPGAVLKGGTIGQLHEESNYGLIRESNKKNYAILAIRKPLLGGKWDEKTIPLIADERIRKEIMKLYEEHDSNKKDWENCLLRYHQETNIRRLRIHISKSFDTISAIEDDRGNAYRYVANGSNYCADVIEHLHGKKAGSWQCYVTTTFDAHRQSSAPSWKAEFPTARKVMRLQINDTVALDQDGCSRIYRVKKIRQNPNAIYLREHSIAKEEKDALSLSGSASFLKKHNARKVYVNELGQVFDPINQSLKDHEG
jgi:CRISPR-associated endonuclease Csn1